MVHRIAARNFYLAKSRIPRAGLGVYSKIAIPKGTYLDRYKGRKLSLSKFDYEASEGLLDSAYAFDVNSGDRHFILDATHPEHSNWTRYMNCSRSFQEENVKFVDRDGKILFYAIQDIHPGDELLFYYGDDYALNRLRLNYRIMESREEQSE